MTVRYLIAKAGHALTTYEYGRIAFDDYRITFEAASALEFDNEYSGSAAIPAYLYYLRRTQARMPLVKS
jgi:hypothetical protein